MEAIIILGILTSFILGVGHMAAMTAQLLAARRLPKAK